MADPCSVMSNWDNIDQIGDLGELINQALDEWGFDPVDVVEGELDGAAGEYDSGIVYLDLSHELFDNPEDALSVAYHEAIHAMRDQYGIGGDGLEEELEALFAGGRAADQSTEGCFSIDPIADSFIDDWYSPPFPWVCDPSSGF